MNEEKNIYFLHEDYDIQNTNSQIHVNGFLKWDPVISLCYVTMSYVSIFGINRLIKYVRHTYTICDCFLNLGQHGVIFVQIIRTAFKWSNI